MVGETPDIRWFRTQVGHKTRGASNSSGGEETGENATGTEDLRFFLPFPLRAVTSVSGLKT
ncbi:hypothetical protein J31TS6_52730 [Brevibacillus reuszeri]|nr:hypothetical protein J31TS6_52730 [Brevibacillus reuszeri]